MVRGMACVTNTRFAENTRYLEEAFLLLFSFCEIRNSYCWALLAKLPMLEKSRPVWQDNVGLEIKNSVIRFFYDKKTNFE
jgi:hypothetical protein